MTSIAALIVGLILLAPDALSQTRVIPQRPVRDAARPVQKGTAVITGRVTTADGRPLRRAQIRVSAAELNEPRVTGTNSQGVFVVRALPAGRYTVNVSRSGFLPLQFGQQRPGEVGRPIQLADGERVEKVDFALPRASAISGLIRDETGEPVAGVTVYAMQFEYYLGRRRLIPIGGVGNNRTDDTGHYRVLSLSPGDYIIMAMLRETWTTRGDVREVLAYAPSYFPGTANAPDAQRVKVGLGQEVTAIDFSLVPGRVATVSGTAMRADGTTMDGASVGLSQEIVGPTASSFSSVASTKSGADGSWTLKDVPPGEYRLSASHTDRERGEAEVSMTIHVQGVPIENVVLTAPSPATLSGIVVTDDGQPLPRGRSSLRVVAESLLPDRRRTGFSMRDENGIVGSDDRFTVNKISGPVLLNLSGLPQGWAVASTEIGGRDHSQMPLELASGQRLDGARVTITKRFPQVTGRVTDGNGKPVSATVLLFPSEASKWFESLASNRTARPDQSGLFRFETVRPGAYLAIALEYVRERQAHDPEFLESLRARATAVTIVEGTNEALDLLVQR